MTTKTHSETPEKCKQCKWVTWCICGLPVGWMKEHQRVSKNWTRECRDNGFIHFVWGDQLTKYDFESSSGNDDER